MAVRQVSSTHTAQFAVTVAEESMFKAKHTVRSNQQEYPRRIIGTRTVIHFFTEADSITLNIVKMKRKERRIIT